MYTAYDSPFSPTTLMFILSLILQDFLNFESNAIMFKLIRVVLLCNSKSSGETDSKTRTFNHLQNNILDWSKVKVVADDQKKKNCQSKIKICFRLGRKHSWKRRKCWLSAMSPFPTVLSKASFQGRKNHGLFGKELRIVVGRLHVCNKFLFTCDPV